MGAGVDILYIGLWFIGTQVEDTCLPVK